jgi:hypothetical protein
VKEEASRESCVEILVTACFKLSSCSTYSSTWKMKATLSFEKSVDFKRATRLCIPGNRTLQGEVTVLIVNSGSLLAATGLEVRGRPGSLWLLSRLMYRVLNRVTGFKGI